MEGYSNEDVLGLFCIMEKVKRSWRQLAEHLMRCFPMTPCTRFDKEEVRKSLGTHYYVCDDAIFSYLRKWALEFYPIYKLRIWIITRPCLLCPEDYELVLTNQKHIKKGKLYEVLLRWLGTGLLTSTGEKWKLRRKILTPAFHFSILQGFLSVFNDQAVELVHRLQSECDNPYTDVVPILSHTTLKVMSETAMGYKMDLESSVGKRYRDSIYAIAKIYIYKLFTLWMFFDKLYRFSPTGIREVELVKHLHAYTNELIAKRQIYYEKSKTEIISYSERKRLAMLDLLLSVRDKENLIDYEGIREEVDTFMFEGHDTTATALSFIFMLLANHRTVQDQILLEMEEVMSDVMKKPTYDELQNLKYMERVIKECLRLYPSVPLIARILGEDLVTSGGHILPKDSEVLLHIYDTHHNPNVFPDPEKFDPDRFLLANCLNRHPFAYVPFSAGHRNCIGQRFAMMELKAVLCGVLPNFVLEPVDTPATLVLTADIVLRTKSGSVKVKFERRKAKM